MMTSIKKTFVWVAAIVALGVLAGCAMPASGLTKEEVQRRRHHTVQNNLWQVQDDIDAFLLLDRPLRLTEMPVR